MAQVGAGGVTFDTERLKTVGKGWLDELFSDEDDAQVLTLLILLALLVQKVFTGTKSVLRCWLDELFSGEEHAQVLTLLTLLALLVQKVSCIAGWLSSFMSFSSSAEEDPQVLTDVC